MGIKIPAAERFSPALTDYPMALLAFAYVSQVFGYALGQGVWWQIAFWCLVTGMVLSVPTLVTCLIDSAPHPRGGSPETTAMARLIAMAAAACAYVGSLVAQGSPSTPGGGRAAVAMALSSLGLVALGVGVRLRWRLALHQQSEV